jgi:cytochrome c oxidase cbb3-type subunit 2
LLPKDAAGGVDWVQALKEGVIAPRPQAPSAPPPEAPFRLESLAQVLNASGEDPLLLDLKLLLEDDMKLVPGDAPFFEVRFPHSSHLLWLNCSSCHPWILGKRGVGMEAIFDGDYCGKCHGKVSYHPETACSRCHVNLRYPREELAQADLDAAGEDPVEVTPELVELGRERYETFCLICHGEEGDGEGDFARFMDPKPDIYRTITFGVKKSSMPAWFELSSRDRWALVHYVKSFSEYFEEEDPDDPIEIPEPPPVNSGLLTLGAEMFAEMQCWDCHGSIGKGDGAAAGTLEDDWGYPIRPADFTQGVFKAGNTTRDIYRTVATGLDGTPMPSFGDILEEEQLWAVTSHTTCVLWPQSRKASASWATSGSRARRAHWECPPRCSRTGSTGSGSSAARVIPPSSAWKGERIRFRWTALGRGSGAEGVITDIPPGSLASITATTVTVRDYS